MDIVVYTDGSSIPNPGKGGWAYIILIDDMEIECNGKVEFTTNNKMEITAVIKALEDLKDTKRNIIIYSDSQYVINCAKKLWKRNKNIELWDQYDKFSNGKNITFNWVKGHSGDHYNSKVDILSKY